MSSRGTFRFANAKLWAFQWLNSHNGRNQSVAWRGCAPHDAACHDKEMSKAAYIDRLMGFQKVMDPNQINNYQYALFASPSFLDNFICGHADYRHHPLFQSQGFGRSHIGIPISKEFETPGCPAVLEESSATQVEAHIDVFHLSQLR